MYLQKSEMLPSFILLLMGSIDCFTTVIGILWFGAIELNPFLVGIVNTSILAFMAVKIAATFCIAGTYILAKRILYKTEDKKCKSFRYGNAFLKVSFVGITFFLVMVVANNLVVLLV